MNKHLINDLKRAEANHKWEPAENGIFVPSAKVTLGGVFGNSLNGDPWQYSDNIVVDQGLNWFIGVTLSAETAVATSYIGIYAGNYAPIAGDDAADIASNSTEITAKYDETDRVAWTETFSVASPYVKTITNSASPADFTFNDSETVYGGFLVNGAVASADTKGGTAGKLIAASKFAASRAVIALDVLSVTYTLTAADA